MSPVILLAPTALFWGIINSSLNISLNGELLSAMAVTVCDRDEVAGRLIGSDARRSDPALE